MKTKEEKIIARRERQKEYQKKYDRKKREKELELRAQNGIIIKRGKKPNEYTHTELLQKEIDKSEYHKKYYQNKVGSRKVNHRDTLVYFTKEELVERLKTRRESALKSNNKRYREKKQNEQAQ